MLIFFGHRSTRIESRKVNASTSCEHCQSQNSFVASIYGNYLHVFWIPLVSTGKAIVVECQHCKKTYHLQDLSPENQQAIQQSFIENPPKSAKWLNLGCFVLVAATLLFIGLVIYGLFTVKSIDEYEAEYKERQQEYLEEYQNSKTEDYDYVPEDPKPDWLRALEKDILNADLYPNEENEPISFALFECLDPDAIKLGKEDVGYFYEIKDDKILILLEAWNLKNLTDKEKDAVYSKINSCLDDILRNLDYERYVGVYDQGELRMQKSPKGFVKDSTAKDSELLKEFYD